MHELACSDRVISHKVNEVPKTGEAMTDDCVDELTMKDEATTNKRQMG